MTIFIDELSYWDGSFTNKDEYFSMEKQNCDVVCAIACCNNVKVSVRQDKSNLWWVHFRKDNLTVGVTTKRTIKKEKVTCVTVSSGIFLARQKGRVFITGNCPSYWVNNTKWENEFWNKLGSYVPVSGQDKNPYKEPTKQITSKYVAKVLGIGFNGSWNKLILLLKLILSNMAVLMENVEMPRLSF